MEPARLDRGANNRHHSACRRADPFQNVPRVAKGPATAILVVLATLAACGNLVGASTPPPPLTHTAAVRRLSPAEAATSVPVHLRGVVTALSGWKSSFFLQDASGGISVDRRDDSPVSQGDQVEIEGVSSPGLFAPVVLSDRVKYLGKGRMPTSREYSWSELALGDWDSQWITLRGVIRSARVAKNWDRGTLILDIQTPDGIVQGLVHDFPGGDGFKRLVDSSVLIQGVCGTNFNDQRQFLGLRLFVPSLDYVQVENSAAAQPFAAPLTPLSRLMQFGSGTKQGHRIRVQGVITFVGSGHTVYLQDRDRGIRVNTSAPVNLTLGARAEASGFIGVEGSTPGLENASIRQISTGPPLQAARSTAADLIRTKDGFSFAPYSGQLVEVDATLVDIIQRGPRQVLLLRSGETSFQAPLESKSQLNLRVGSLLRLTGICEVKLGADGIPRAVEMLLRSTDDVKVLTAPFWTLLKATWLVAGSMAALCWILLRTRFVTGSRPELPPVADVSRNDANLSAKIALLSRYLGLSGGVLGVIVLVGWMAGIRSFTSLIPGYAPMAPNSAFAAILLAIAIYVDSPVDKMTRRWSRGRIIGTICCLVVMAIGAASALQVATGVNLHIDRVFMSASAGIPSPSDRAPGRVAASTALNMVLLGLALLFRRTRRLTGWTQALIFLASVCCLLHVMRVLYGSEGFEYFSRWAMSLPALCVFLLLCFGVFLARPDEGVMKIILARGPGGILARRLVPAAFLIPSALGWLRWQGQQNGIYGTPAGLVLFTSSLIIVFTFMILLTSAVLNRLDGIRSSAERDLRDSQNRLVQLADAMPGIVWTAGAGGEHDYFNRRWFEYTAQKTHASLENDIRSAIHPDDLELRDRMWRYGRDTGNSFTTELRLKDTAGEYRWHLLRAVAIRGERDEVVRWIGTYTDVEDYKQIQEAMQRLNGDLEARVDERTAQIQKATSELEQTYAQLQGIMDSTTQVAVVFVDEHRIIRMFNRGAEKMLGYQAEEVVGIRSSDVLLDPGEVSMRLARLSHERGTPAVRDDLFINPALKGVTEFTEWSYVRKDGRLVPVALGVTAVRNAAGELMGFLGVATDISMLKAMEIALRRNNQELTAQTAKAETANRAKDVFLATLSHEIRTPMNAILGISDILLETTLDAEQRNYVEICRRAGSALMFLIDDMLDLSKIEAGHLELENIEFDLEEVLDQALELTAPKARAKKLTLALRNGPHLPAFVMGDPARLRQILLNLLGNAVKFTQTGEVVLSVVNTSQPGTGCIGFAISDTGIGIPTDKLEAIFEDFQQADSSTTRNYGGTGLGLGISRRLVERMGGRLTVESKLDVGSTFRFNLEFQLPANPRALPALPVAELRGAHALVLDDNLTNRVILLETLSSWGMVCADFASPGEALVSLQVKVSSSEPYDVVLIDCHMEEMNGFKVARCIRAISPGTPVVMLTSDAQVGDTAKRVEAGLAGHAVKPVRKSHLLRLLGDAMKTSTTGQPLAVPANLSLPAPETIPPLRILVAEDMPDNQLLVRAYMKGSPHQLTFVEDGSQAVAAFSRGSFGLVLMDMLMPVMDGLSATAAIREFERTHGRAVTPIIAFSANASPADVNKSLQAGCQYHLSKPISKGRLLAVIEEYGVPSPELPPDEECAEEAALMKAINDELVPQYLDDRRQDVAALSALLASRDFDRIAVIGHNLKGSGTSYGFPEISSLGGAMESAAESHQIEALRQNLTALVRVMENIHSDKNRFDAGLRHSR